MIHTFAVNDMSCKGCAAKITKSVSALAGVTNVVAEIPTKLVHVTAGEGVTPAQISEAIGTAGYHAEAPAAKKASDCGCGD